jgi:hypothetical protein
MVVTMLPLLSTFLGEDGATLPTVRRSSSLADDGRTERTADGREALSLLLPNVKKVARRNSGTSYTGTEFGLVG